MAVVITIFIGLIFFTLYKNGANLSQSPGMVKRLGVFFSVNVASTSDSPDFEELRTPVFDMDTKDLYQRVLNAGSDIGWEIVSKDDGEQSVKFIVRSSLFSFKDDVSVQVKTISSQQSSLFIKSRSQKGKADFAANSGHIQKLVNYLNDDI